MGFLVSMDNALSFYMAISNEWGNLPQSVIWIWLTNIGQNTWKLDLSVPCRRKIMNRFEQRKQKFLQDSEVMEGYQEMAVEFQLM